MSADAPAVSVIVPSYNRRDSLDMVVGALAEQRGVAPGAMEVVIVLDGSTDGSDAMLDAWVRSGRVPGLRWQLRKNGGQSAARDAGARATTAPVVLFLDDDVVPEPDLVARHLRWHAAGERVAVLGDYELVRGTDAPLYTQRVWAWWEELFTSRVQPGRLPCYHDFCTGNVSLRRDDYLATGGFDPAFRGYGGEDYELGYRLLQNGVRFIADREARGMHHHRFAGYENFLRARQQEGHADVLLGTKHPELRAGLRVASRIQLMPPYDRIARSAFAPRGMSPLALRARIAQAELAERMGRRFRWDQTLGALSVYHYWRGIYEALGSWEAAQAFRREAHVPVQDVDVTRAVSVAAETFWVHGPSDLRVTASGQLLGIAPLRGPITKPLATAIVEAVEGHLSVPLLLHAERTGTPLFGGAARPQGV